MYRFYWKHNRDDSKDIIKQIKVLRIEGGFWFSEQTFQIPLENLEARPSSLVNCESERQTYKLINRNYSKGLLSELLEEVEPNLVQGPCWQDGLKQDLLLLGQVEGQERLYWSSETGMYQLSLPLDCPLPGWVKEFLPDSEIYNQMQTNMTNMKISSLKDLDFHGKQKQQDLKPKEVFHSQTGLNQLNQGSFQVQSSQEHVKELQSQGPVFGIPKGVQAGSLYPPTDLRLLQGSRKTIGYSQANRRQNGQGHSCLINLDLS